MRPGILRKKLRQTEDNLGATLASILKIRLGAITNPWIIFRLSEFYLNYAETQIALGDEGEARTAINKIRAKYAMPDVVESGADLVTRYRRERRVELSS